MILNYCIMDLKVLIWDILDFFKLGIMFRDIIILFNSLEGLCYIIDFLVE